MLGASSPCRGGGGAFAVLPCTAITKGGGLDVARDAIPNHPRGGGRRRDGDSGISGATGVVVVHLHRYPKVHLMSLLLQTRRGRDRSYSSNEGLIYTVREQGASGVSLGIIDLVFFFYYKLCTLYSVLHCRYAKVLQKVPWVNISLKLYTSSTACPISAGAPPDSPGTEHKLGYLIDQPN